MNSRPFSPNPGRRGSCKILQKIIICRYNSFYCKNDYSFTLTISVHGVISGSQFCTERCSNRAGLDAMTPGSHVTIRNRESDWFWKGKPRHTDNCNWSTSVLPIYPKVVYRYGEIELAQQRQTGRDNYTYRATNHVLSQPSDR